jgi:exosortase/archaeosortase family protein
MLVIFFALSTAFAFLVNQPLWQKIILVVSAVPIALIANITRITVTGIMHETVGHKAANLVFHDLAGWLMMPFALVMLWLELKAFSWLIVEEEVTERGRISSAGVSVKSSNGKTSNGKRRRSQKTFLPPAPHGPRQA